MGRTWFLKALAAAVITAVVGLLLLGLPGGFVLEGLKLIGRARQITGDRAWPAAIVITIAGAMSVIPASLALRFWAEHLAGWRHGLATAGVAFALTFVVSALLLA